MGLLHSLVNWGIRVIDNTDTDIRRIGQRLGKWPLSWRHVVTMNPSKEGLLWRVPDPDVPMASSLTNVQAILVTDYEQVMVFRNGVRIGGERITLTPGLYDFSRAQMREQLEIIWTTAREFQLPWGVPDVLTQDRISIGASGHYRAVISDPETFLLKVAGNAQVFREEHLSAFAKSEVNSALRDLMARKTVMEFQLARREFLGAAQEMLMFIFEGWGLEFKGLTIENQRLPEQFLQAAAAKTIISMEKQAQVEGAQADLSLAQLEAQKAIYLAQIEASKMLALGRAQVEIMQEQQRIGIDPLEIKRIEAVQTFAANPSQGTLIDNRTQMISEILAQPPASTLMPSTITGSVHPAISQPATPALPSGDAGNGPSTLAEPASSGGTMTRQEIIQQLDTLAELLIYKKISPQKYAELSDNLHKQLGELPLTEDS